jgi:hypothetical protein
MVFSLGWMLKTAHVLLAHTHDHGEHLVCALDYGQNATHIHDERFAPDDCSLCAFVLSDSEPPSLFDIRCSILPPLPRRGVASLPTLLADRRPSHISLRGPPM